MALAGIHVSCCTIGGKGRNNTVQSLLSKTIWSETLAGTSGATFTTTQAAPSSSDSDGDPSFEISTDRDVFVVVENPNVLTLDPTQAVSTNSSNARFFLFAGTQRNVFAPVGAKVAVRAA